jgi:hypothetical protein
MTSLREIFSVSSRAHSAFVGTKGTAAPGNCHHTRSAGSAYCIGAQLVLAHPATAILRGTANETSLDRIAPCNAVARY